MLKTYINGLKISGRSSALGAVIGTGINKSPNSRRVEIILNNVHRTIERIGQGKNARWQLCQLFDFLDGYGIDLNAWSAIREYIDMACKIWTDMYKTDVKIERENNGNKTVSDNHNYHRLYDNDAYRAVTKVIANDLKRGDVGDEYLEIVNAMSDCAMAASGNMKLVRAMQALIELAVNAQLSNATVIAMIQYIARFKVGK